MASAGDRILLVEHDPKISDLIARQVLIAEGYDVNVVVDSSAAIKEAFANPPDLIISDLNLPGLSTKDLLVALASQGVNTPLLVIANKGQEQDIIQAFRLGAADYLLWPARDAEVLSAVERVLGRVHETRYRQRLDVKVNELNRELQRRMRTLTTLIGIGKAVVSITDHRVLFQKIVEGAAQITEAKTAWILIRDDEDRSFLLTAQHGLPDVWAKKMNRPLDDGISGMVALSGETLSIVGEPLMKFKVANLGKSACAVPIKIQKEVIGILVIVRTEARPFEKMEQVLLESIADYATIALLDARLFRVVNNSMQISKDSEKRQNALIESLHTVTKELQAAVRPVDLLLEEKAGRLTDHQRQALQATRAALRRLGRAAEKTMPPITTPLQKK